MNSKISTSGFVNIASDFYKLKKPKTSYTLLAAALFIVLSHPNTYLFVNQYLDVSDKKGCPSNKGLLVHAIVFMIIFRIILEYV